MCKILVFFADSITLDTQINTEDTNGHFNNIKTTYRIQSNNRTLLLFKNRDDFRWTTQLTKGLPFFTERSKVRLIPKKTKTRNSFHCKF